MQKSKPHRLRPLTQSLACLATSAAVTAALLCASGVVGKGATSNWDPSKTPTTPSGGAGTWDLTSLLWSDLSTDQAWPNAIDSIAAFGGVTGGAVVINTAGGPGVQANGLGFTTSGYTISSSAATDVLTLVGTNPTISLTGTALSETISANIAGSNGLTLTSTDSTSVLTLSGTNTFSGGILIQSGILNVTNLASVATNDISVGTGGTFQTNAATAGTLNNNVILSGGTLSQVPANQVALGAGKTITFNGSGNVINVTAAGPGGKILTVDNQLAGTGSFTKTGNGDFQLGSNPAFAPSSVVVTGGQLEFQSANSLGSTVTSVTVGGTGEFVATGVPVMHNFTLNTGATLSANGSGGGDFQGAINVVGNSNIALRLFQTPATPNSFKIDGALSGSGNLTITAPVATTTVIPSLLLTGNNGGYSGNIAVGANAQLRAVVPAGVSTLGTGNITLSGSTLGLAPVVTAGGTAGFQGRYYLASPAGSNVSEFITNGVIGGYDFGLTGTPGTVRTADATRTDATIAFADFTQAAQRPTGFNPTGNANFGVLWTGVLNITTGGSYTFSTASDDGNLLYVDGQPVVLSDFSQGVTTRTGVITLASGFHSLVVKYGQGTGGTSMTANYNGPDTANATVNIGSIAGSVTNNGAIIQGTTSIANNIVLADGQTSGIDLSATTATSTGTLTFGAGARLNITGLTGAETLTQQGSVTLNGANVLSAGTPQAPGNLQNASAGADVIISGSIGESVAGSSLIKVGPHNLTLSNTNTYTGSTSFTGGTLLSLSAPSGLSIPGNLTLNPLAITGVSLTAREFANDQIGNAGVVTLLGYNGVAGSNLDLNNFNDTIGGVVIVNNQGTGTETVSTGTGTLTLNGDVNISGTSTGANTFSGNLNLGGATRTFTVNGLGAATISALITNGNLTKTGLAGLTLSGANAGYSGLTTINTGKLSISNATALGTTGAGANTIVNPGGILDIVNVNTAEPLTLNGRGQPNFANTGINNFGLSYTGALQGSGGFNAVASGPITLGSDGAAVGAAAGSLLTISGVISDGGLGYSLTKTQGNNAALVGTGAASAGPGIVKLTGANTYTGATIVTAGDLWLANPTGQAIQSTSIVIGDGTDDAALTMVNNNQFPASAIITFNGGSKNAKFQLNGTTQTVAGFANSANGAVPIIQNHENGAAGAGTLIVNNPVDTTFAGLIRDQNSTLAVTKQGTGTLTFSGNGAFGTAGAIYTGLTSVTNGKLLLSDETGFNSPVTISSTGTFEVNLSYGRSLTYGKVITDNGIGFTKSGAGSLIFNNVAQSITGTINITGGALNFVGATIPTAAPINIAAGARLEFFGVSGTPLTFTNNVTLNGLTPGGAIVGAAIAGTPDDTLSGTITLNGAGMNNVSTGWSDKTFRMTGQMTGSGGLQFDKLLYTQNQPVFSVTNTTNNYAGGTTINAGSVYFANGALPAGNLTFGGTFQSGVTPGGGLILGTNGQSGFTLGIGTGAGQVQFTGDGGGFSAIGGTQTISFGGGGSVDWGAAGFSPNASLFFNASTALGTASTANADSEINLTNDITLSTAGMRRVFVYDNNGVATDQVRFSGAISGAGGLIKDGQNSAGGANLQGTLILSGANDNTYTGLTEVIGGVLRLNKSAGVVAVPGDLQIGGAQNNGTRRIVFLGANEQIADTSTVSFIGSSANNGDLRMFGFSETVGGILDRSGGGVLEIAEATDTGVSNSMVSTLTLNGNADSFYNGFLRNNSSNNATTTGALSIVKNGTGTLTISAGQQSGTGSVTYSGPTAINSGSLVYANLTTFNSAPTIAFGATLGFLENINQSGTFGQVISGAGGVLKTGPGTINLSQANTYGGNTEIAGGTLIISGQTNTTGNYLVDSGATLQIGNNGTTGQVPDTNSITDNGTVVLNRSNDSTYLGVISGSGGVTKAANATANFVLGGLNTYSGVTVVNGNTLTLNGAGASAGGVVINSGGAVAGNLIVDFGQNGAPVSNILAPTTPVTLNGGTLTINVPVASTASQSLGNVTVNGASSINPTLGGIASLTLSLGTITATPGGSLNINFPQGLTATTTSTGIGGILGGFATANSGINFVGVDGSGNLTPFTSGQADTYGVGVNTDVISGGAGGSTNSLRFDISIPDTVTFTGTNTIASGGILVTADVGANDNVISGGTLLSGLGVGFYVTQGNTAGGLNISSVLANNGGAAALTKAGAGTLTLSGLNTYSSGTFVTQGTLIDTGSLGSGAVNVSAGATLQIGDGTTNGTVSTFGANSGTVLFNNGSAQTMSTPFNASSTFNFTNNALLNPTTFQTGSFQKIGTQTLTITNALPTSTFHVRGGTAVLDTGANVVVSSFTSVGLLTGDSGTLTVKGVGKFTDSNDFNVGDVTGTSGTLNLQDQGVISVDNLFVGKSGTAVGVVNQTNGTLQRVGGGSVDWRIGGNGSAADASAYGIYNLSGGTFTTSVNFQIGAFGLGVFNQSGGTVTTTGGFPDVGRFTGGSGLLNISNGLFTNSTVSTSLIVGEQGTGVLNLSGSGIMTLPTTSGGGVTGLRLGHTAGGVGIANLLGGTLISNGVSMGGGTAAFNFNGGVLRAGVASTTFMTGLTNAFVYSGGANIDTNGLAITIGQPLLAPSNTGVTGISVGSGGSGYVGEPIVVFTGGTPLGGLAANAATARAIVSGGAIVGFVVTNPGNYTVPPTGITFQGGGGTGATVGTITTAANVTTGGLTKLNTGVLTMTGTSTYGGSTTITGGSITEAFGSTSATNILPATGLVINGGGLTMTGFAAGTNSQTFSGVTINNPGSIVSNIGTGGTMTATLNAITRNAGGSVDFSGTGTINTLTANTGGTILGGWATFGGTGWAVSAGTGAAAGNITALGSYTANTWAAGNNTDATASSTQTGVTTNSLRFNTAAAVTLTVSGADVITTGGILETATVGNNATVITGGTSLAAGTNNDLVISQFNGSNTLSIATPIIANGTGGLVKAGTGVLILNAAANANTYAGDTVIGAGTLRLGVANQIPDGAGKGNVTIDAGASLDLANLAETINGLSGYGSVVNSVAGTPVLTVGGNNVNSTFSGLIVNGTGNVALTKIGTGVLTLNNIVAGSFTGATTISAGAIDIATPQALANNTTITVGSANGLLFDTTVPQISGLAGAFGFALQTQASSPVPNAPVQLTLGNNNASATYTGVLSGSGTVIKAGTGIQTLGGANTNTGGVIANAGVLELSGNNSGASGPMIVNAGGALQLKALNSIYGSSGTSILVANGGVLTLGSFTSSATSAGFGPITPVLSRIDPGSTGVLALQVDATLQTPISENLDFSANNINLSLGASLAAASGFGNAPVQYTGVITPNGGIFRLGGGSGRLILPNAATLGGANSLNIGGGSLTANNGGQLFLTANYGFTGSTTFNSGTTLVTALANGGAASPLGASSSAASNLVFNGGTLQYIGNGSSTDRLFTLGSAPTALDASGSGLLNFTNTGALAFLNTGNRTFTLQGNNTGANTLAAAIGDSINVTGANGTIASGTTAITKNGNGTWVLSGANTFTGGVTINNGVLEFTNLASMGSNTVNGPASILVNAGGAATLGSSFTGSIQAALNRISPLSSGTLALTSNTNETLNLDGGASGAGLPLVSLGAYGNVTYTGTLTPFANTYRFGGGGGVLTLPNGGLTGPRSVVISGGGPGTTFGNNPNLNGAVVLGGTSDYSGGTVLGTGAILSATSLTALGSGPLKFQGGFYRATNGTDITLASDGVSAREIRIGTDASGVNSTANVDVVGGINLTFSQTFGQLATLGSNLGNGTAQSFTKWGAGSLTLANGITLGRSDGSNTLASNSGTLTVERGTLTLMSNPTNFNGLIQVGSNNGGIGTLKLGANNVFANTTAVYTSGSIFDTYAGSTIDLNGFSDTLRLVRGMGSIANSGVSSANLTVGTGNEVGILGGNLIGNFTLTKGGQVTNLFGTGATANALELWNANNQLFTGKLVANAGGIRIRADGTLGATTEPATSDKITLNNNAFLQAASTAGATPVPDALVIGANHGITLGSGGGVLWAMNSSPFVVNSPITGSGALTVADDTGTVMLGSDNNSYTGGTVINSNAAGRGMLSIGVGGTSGSLPAGTVTFNSGAGLARLFFFKSSDLTLSNAFNGPGQLIQLGSGTTTLNGNNTTLQTTFVGGGRLKADFSTGGSPIGAGTSLQIGGGAFEYFGPDGDNSLRLGALTATVPGLPSVMNGGGIGDGTVQSTYGGSGTQSLIFTSNARGTAGSTMNFVTSGGVNGVTNSIIFQAGPALNTVIGGAYYFNGADFAAVDRTNFVRAGIPGTDVNFAALNTLSNGQYSKVTNQINNQATLAIAGLNLSGSTGNLNMAAAGILTLNANPGALLKSGGGTSVINGGTGATVSDNNQELIVRADLATDILQIDLPITGTGQLTKSGLGQLILDGVNTFTGATFINQGTIRVTGNGVLGGTGSGEIRMANAAGETATLTIDSPTASISTGTGVNALRVGESGIGIVNQSAGVVTAARNLALGENFGASGTYNMTGGTLNIKTDNSQATPAFIVGRAGTGNFSISGSSVVNVNNGAQILLGVGTANPGQFQGLIPNAGVSTGVGTITQTGGTINVSLTNGTFQSNVFGQVVLGVDGAGTYNLNGGTLSTPMLGRGNGVATFNLGGGTLKAAANTLNVDLPITLTGTGAGKGTVDTNGNDITFTGALGGSGGLAKAGTGSLSVLGSNSNYSGGTDINGGNIVSSGTSLGTGTVNIASGASLTMQGVQQGLLAKFYPVTRTDVTPGNTAATGIMYTEFSSLSNFNTFLAGKASVADESTTARGKTSVDYLDIGAANQNTALPPALIALANGSNPFAAQLTGQFNATVAGDYTFQTRSDDGSEVWIDGQPVIDNDRSQGQTVRSGTVTLTAGLHDIVVGYFQGTGGGGFSVGVTQPGQGQSYTIGAGELNLSNSLLSYGSNDLTIGALAGAGNVNMAAGILKVNATSGSNTFSGALNGVAGSSFVKEGASTQIMTGDSHTSFTGPVSVNGGALVVNGSLSGSTVAVNSTATLGGSGATGPITVNSGGTVAPGNGIGTLNVGTFNLKVGGALSLELGPAVAGTGYDQLSVTGSVTLAGDAKLSIAPGFADHVGDIFYVILNDGTDAVTGTFNGIAQGGTLSLPDGHMFSVNYAANGDGGAIGNDVSVTLLAVPEPGTASCLLAGLGSLIGLQRFRRRR